MGVFDPLRRAQVLQHRETFVRILVEARDLLARTGNDFSRSTWDDRDEAVQEMNAFIQSIVNGTFTDVDGLKVLFMPTGPVQEVSFSGWSDEFLVLAERFDRELVKFF
jgi:hypothetical protein